MLRKQTAAVILVATQIPLADFLLLAVTLLATVLVPDPLPADWHRAMIGTWGMFHWATVPWTWTLAVVYWVFLFRVRGITYPRQVCWGLGVFFFSGLAMPAFWYLYLCPVARRPGSPAMAEVPES